MASLEQKLESSSTNHPKDGGRFNGKGYGDFATRPFVLHDEARRLNAQQSGTHGGGGGNWQREIRRVDQPSYGSQSSLHGSDQGSIDPRLLDLRSDQGSIDPRLLGPQPSEWIDIQSESGRTGASTTGRIKEPFAGITLDEGSSAKEKLSSHKNILQELNQEKQKIDQSIHGKVELIKKCTSEEEARRNYKELCVLCDERRKNVEKFTDIVKEGKSIYETYVADIDDLNNARAVHRQTEIDYNRQEEWYQDVNIVNQTRIRVKETEDKINEDGIKEGSYETYQKNVNDADMLLVRMHNQGASIDSLMQNVSTYLKKHFQIDIANVSDQSSSDYIVPEKHLSALVDAVIASKQPNAPKFSSRAFLQSIGENIDYKTVVLTNEHYQRCKDFLKAKGVQRVIYERVSMALLQKCIKNVNKDREAHRVTNMSKQQLNAIRARARKEGMSKQQLNARRARQRVVNMSKEQLNAKRARDRKESMSEEQLNAKRARARKYVEKRFNRQKPGANVHEDFGIRSQSPSSAQYGVLGKNPQREHSSSGEEEYTSDEE